jgi:hypothetical protein
MTILIDDALVAAPIRVALVEGWIEHPVEFEVRPSLKAADVGPADLALIPVAEATLLAATHVVIPDVAVIYDGVSDIAMRTPVRPDGIEAVPVRLLDVGGTAELLIRALLRPYFGITASTFVRSDEDPAAANAQVVIVDGLTGLDSPEYGFQEDLARSWFILTGSRVPGHVFVAGVEAFARGIEPELVAMREAIAAGKERRREVRIQIAEASGGEVDRDRLAELTNRLTFAFEAEDRQSLSNLISRGTWGGPYPRAMPVFSDEVPE